MNSFQKIAPRGAYAQVVEQLEERILRVEFPENELLPSEAALAAQLGVGRRVLREALRSLEIKGLVEIRHGVGTMVRRNDLNSFLNALQQKVRSFLSLNRADAEQVRHLRLLFESAAIDGLSEGRMRRAWRRCPKICNCSGRRPGQGMQRRISAIIWNSTGGL